MKMLTKDVTTEQSWRGVAEDDVMSDDALKRLSRDQSELTSFGRSYDE